MLLVILDLDWSPFLHVLDTHVRRIANYRVESSCFHDFGKARLPIEGVNPLSVCVPKQRSLLRDLWANKRVPTDDVVFEFRKKVLFGRQLRALAFEGLEVQTHHSDLDGLRVYIHAEKVVLQYLRFANDGKARFAILVSDYVGKQCVTLSLFRVLAEVAHVIVDQALKCANEE